jgi:hypothetical protein
MKIIITGSLGHISKPLTKELIVIAEEIEKPFEGWSVRYIASEALTCNEVAKILGEAIGKPYLKWAAICDKMLANTMLKRGMNEKMVKALWKLARPDAPVSYMKIITNTGRY